MQSAKPFLQVGIETPPPPSPAGECALPPPLWFRGGGGVPSPTLAYGRGGGESQFRRLRSRIWAHIRGDKNCGKCIFAFLEILNIWVLYLYSMSPQKFNFFSYEFSKNADFKSVEIIGNKCTWKKLLAENSKF
jgi:hypothetical protein